MIDVPREPQHARCECGHVWIMAYLPMLLTDWVRLARGARCPMCASRNVFVCDAVPMIDSTTRPRDDET